MPKNGPRCNWEQSSLRSVELWQRSVWSDNKYWWRNNEQFIDQSSSLRITEATLWTQLDAKHRKSILDHPSSRDNGWSKTDCTCLNEASSCRGSTSRWVKLTIATATISCQLKIRCRLKLKHQKKHLPTYSYCVLRDVIWRQRKSSKTYLLPHHATKYLHLKAKQVIQTNLLPHHATK